MRFLGGVRLPRLVETRQVGKPHLLQPVPHTPRHHCAPVASAVRPSLLGLRVRCCRLLLVSRCGRHSRRHLLVRLPRCVRLG